MLGRRALLQHAGVIGAAWAGLQLTGCSDDSNADPASSTIDSAPETTTTVSEDQTAVSATSSDRAKGGRVLLAYFSRAGENYYYGDRIDLTVGNTQVVADMIRAAIPVDVYRIEAAEPYSDSYDETVARNVREQETDAGPAIANPLPNVRLRHGAARQRHLERASTDDHEHLPRSRRPHRQRLVPFVTYAVSGLGRTIQSSASLTLTFEELPLPAEPGLTMTAYTAEAGSASHDALALLASWTAPSHDAVAAAERDARLQQ